MHYIEGDNIAIEVRWAEGLAERFPQLMAELNGLKVDVLLVSAAAGALAAKNAATTPAVFAAVTDPIGGQSDQINNAKLKLKNEK